MNNRIIMLAAAGIIGSAAIGLETLAVSRVARGAGEWLGSPAALALGRAGRIAAEALGHEAAHHAREVAWGATIGVVRGLGAVYAATQSRPVTAPAPEEPASEIRVLHTWRTVQVDVERCCETRKKLPATS